MERLLRKLAPPRTFQVHYRTAHSLYRQKKYEEAERAYRQAVQEREKVLGRDHADTINARCWTAHSLFYQKKYEEAERMYRQVVQEREKVLGPEYADTIDARYWWTRSLYEQRQFEQAERLFRQILEVQVIVLGPEDANTIETQYGLALTLYEQKQYEEGEPLLRHVLNQRKKVLEKVIPHKVNSEFWLVEISLTRQDDKGAADIYSDPLRISDINVGPERQFHISPMLRMRSSQTSIPNFAARNLSPAASTRLSGSLSTFFTGDKDSRSAYMDAEILEISSLLRSLNPPWEKVPRMYIVLRTIGHLDLLDQFIDLGFSDHWFPVTARTLPQNISPSIRSSFVQAQDLILTKSLDLVKGKSGRHHHFKQGEHLPLEPRGRLGSGGFGEVDRVLNTIDFREYARKRIRRRGMFTTAAREEMESFITELQVLKRLEHQHVVDLVGSYTDPRYVGLIMSPIADMDLAAYLKNVQTSQFPELRTFFGCLAAALQYLHDHRIRHKDIKPSNILVHRGTVLFTDFGLSRDFTDLTGSTTFGRVNGLSPRYSAPEVFAGEPRNTSSDIWSLGLVFLEMVVVLKGQTLVSMNSYLEENGSKTLLVRDNPIALTQFLAKLKDLDILSDNRALNWVRTMVRRDQKSRPTAAELVASIHLQDETSEGLNAFCGSCCISTDSDYSDVEE
jgi:TolA-binding protein